MHTAVMSDLRVATDKFFLTGGKDENFLPEIKDVGSFDRIFNDQHF